MRYIFVFAAMWLVLAAEVRAQNFTKGLMAYLAGDYATALAEWRPLAEQGNANAQTNLGNMYLFGTGVSRDDSEAVRWYRLAAEQGNVIAQISLGRMYANGDAVLQDYDKAEQWFRAAADQGNAFAQFGLGLMYRNGKGVPQNDADAMVWLSFPTSRLASSFKYLCSKTPFNTHQTL